MEENKVLTITDLATSTSDVISMIMILLSGKWRFIFASACKLLYKLYEQNPMVILHDLNEKVSLNSGYNRRLRRYADLTDWGALQYINISGWKTFMDKKRIRVVYLEHTENLHILNLIPSLTSLTLKSATLTNDMKNVFSKLVSLKLLHLHEYADNGINLSKLLADCTSLKELSIASQNQYRIQLPQHLNRFMFSGCHLSEGLDASLCNQLTHVEIFRTEIDFNVNCELKFIPPKFHSLLKLKSNSRLKKKYIGNAFFKVQKLDLHWRVIRGWSKRGVELDPDLFYFDISAYECLEHIRIIGLDLKVYLYCIFAKGKRVIKAELIKQDSYLCLEAKEIPLKIEETTMELFENPFCEKPLVIKPSIVPIRSPALEKLHQEFNHLQVLDSVYSKTTMVIDKNCLGLQELLGSYLLASHQLINSHIMNQMDYSLRTNQQLITNEFNILQMLLNDYSAFNPQLNSHLNVFQMLLNSYSTTIQLFSSYSTAIQQLPNESNEQLSNSYLAFIQQSSYMSEITQQLFSRYSAAVERSRWILNLQLPNQ